MKIYNKTLKKAYRYLRSGKDGKVIALLEPKVPLFLENFHFYYILGVACFRSGDTGGAETYLKRAVQVNRKAPEPRLYLAAVSLRKKDTAGAVRLWLGILDSSPKNRCAIRGLNRIRKITDQETLVAYLDRGRFAPFLPRIRKPLPWWIYVFLFLLAAGGGLYGSRGSWLPLLEQAGRESRENLTSLYREVVEKGDLHSDSPEGILFNLTDEEIVAALKGAQASFNEYRDNEARREINRIVYSNASESVKQKARLLEGYLKAPDMTSFSGNVSFRDVSAEPYLYNGCHVLWKGRLSNLAFSDAGQSFDFLVGYETAQVLEGIVPVVLDFQVRLDPAFPLELLGEVQVLDDRSFRIRGLSVHNIIEP